MEYDYRSFRLPLLFDVVAFAGGPAPGEEFPDFDLPTADGERLTREQLLARGPALITIGSFTSPMAASASPALRRLHREFGQPVSFATLYVREAHPGRLRPQPDSMELKARHARDFAYRDEIPWTVIVDEIEGTLHRQLDAKPNAAYLVDEDGIVVFRSLWSGHEWTLREALAVVAAGGRPMEQREPRIVPMVAGLGDMYRVLELSGDDAKRDVLYHAPPLYVLARLAHVLPFAGPLQRGLGALGVVVGLTMGALIGVARSNRRQTALRDGLDLGEE